MKTHKLLVITSLVLVAMLITTGMVFAVGAVNQGTASTVTSELAIASGGGHNEDTGNQSPVGGGDDSAAVAAQEIQSTITTIAAAAGGSTEPPQKEGVAKGATIENNDFTIERTGANDTLGDGIDEATLWTFDFTTDPDFRRFQDLLRQERLQSALLTLGLIPKNQLISNDILKVGNLPAIGAQDADGGVSPFGFPPIQELPLDIASNVEIELLSFYTPEEIQSVLRKSPRGKVPMRFGDDAIVVFAHLRLSVDTTKN